jgi:hypothetical protein
MRVSELAAGDALGRLTRDDLERHDVEESQEPITAVRPAAERGSTLSRDPRQWYTRVPWSS